MQHVRRRVVIAFPPQRVAGAVLDHFRRQRLVQHGGDAGGLGTFSQDGDGLAYGAGFQLSNIPFTKLRLEYTRYQPDDAEVDSFGISALLQF